MRPFDSFEQEPQSTKGGPRLIDEARKKLVPDMPEERVRQEVLRGLVKGYGYPVEALLSEEPIARGTKDRRRADVIIRLRSKDVRAEFREDGVVEALARESGYGEKVRQAKEVLTAWPELRLQRLPDEVSLPVDGEELTCRVLGFARMDAGHCLVLEPPDEARQRLHLPRVLPVQVNGYGQTESEVRLAKSLGIPGCQWLADSTLDFIDLLAPRDGAERVRRLFEQTLLGEESDEVVRAELVVYPVDDDEFGVLLIYEPEFDAEGNIVGEDEPELVETSEHPRDESAKEPEVAKRQRGWASNDVAFAVIECKAPGVDLDEAVVKMGRGYVKKLGARFLVITNGAAVRFFSHRGKGELVELNEQEDFPTYAVVLKDESHSLAPEQPYRARPKLPADASDRPDCVRFHTRYRSPLVGTKTPQGLWAPLLAFDDHLVQEQPLVNEPVERHDVRFCADLGVNYHDTGSPVGAGWPGLFRDLLIESADGYRMILGLAIQGAWKRANKKLISRYEWVVSSHCYFIAALSDDAEYETVLQLDVDKGTVRDGDGWLLTHNGAMTAGKGAVKRSLLFDAMREAHQELVDGKRILLGRLPREVPMPLDDFWEIVSRIAAYVLVRRRVKNEVKAARKR